MIILIENEETTINHIIYENFKCNDENIIIDMQV